VFGGEIKKKRQMRGLALVVLLALTMWAGCSTSQGVAGVSVTPRQAFEMWRAAPGRVNILDVRTPAEYVFVGHAPMARNIPLVFAAHKWDAQERRPVIEPNPRFVDEAIKCYKPDDVIVTMCADGKRGAKAAEALKAAGFTQVLNMEGGFDGEYADDCSDCGTGKAVKPGWRNCGLIWTRAVDRESFYTVE